MQLSSRALTSLGAALFLVASAMPAMADTVLYNQPWDGTGNVYSSQNDTSGGFGNFATVYDNFTLGSTSTITDVNWTGGFFNPIELGSITAFTVTLWSNSGGQPGSMLYQDVQSGNAAQTGCGIVNGVSEICTYSENLLTPFVAQAGTQYWLSIVPNLGFPPQWGWASGTGGDGIAYQDFFGVRSQLSADMAFGITGTVGGGSPEPFTFGLMGSGLAVLGLAKWRRNRA